jgi:hypothetical protein
MLGKYNSSFGLICYKRKLLSFSMYLNQVTITHLFGGQEKPLVPSTSLLQGTKYKYGPISATHETCI